MQANTFPYRLKQSVKSALTDSTVQIEPTRRCNFKCVHCTHRDNEGHIEQSVYLSILARHKKCRVVKLQGLGEPLLHPEIQQLVDLAKANGRRVMVITNGSGDYIDNVDHYVFSLETMAPDVFQSIGKSNLPKILDNIRYAASRQKIVINCVQCHKTTPQDVAGVKEFANDIGADIWITPQEVWVDPSHPDHREQVAKTKLAWQIHGICPHYQKYRVCNWGVSEFYYDYTGAAHPCCIRMTDEYRNALPSRQVCSSCPL